MSVLGELDSLVLRDTSHSPLTNKGSELTYTEWDAQTTKIYDAIQSIVSGTNVTAYNSGTTYNKDDASIYNKFSSYNGRIWKAVYTGGSFSNQTPEEGVYWTQVTLAELIPDVLKVVDKTENGFEKPYEATEDIPVGGDGVTVTISSATIEGEVWDVAVWDGNTRVYPTVIKGTSGSDQTVQIVSAKAYTGASIYVTMKKA